MDRPTANDVRSWSKLDYAAYGYAETADPDETPDPLDRILAESIAYVEQTTGRVPIEDVPLELEALAEAAVRMRVEQLTVGSSAATIEEAFEALGNAGIQSFSVPGYSETRFKPEAGDWYKRLNWWPALAEVLWLLMTPEKREEWEARLNGYHAPAMATTEIDWAEEYPTTAPDPWLGGWPGQWY